MLHYAKLNVSLFIFMFDNHPCTKPASKPQYDNPKAIKVALTKKRASIPFIGPIPLCGTTKKKVAETIAKWLVDKALECW